MKKRILGIIGGSGLYQIEGLENIKWKKVIHLGVNLQIEFYQQH